MMKNYLKYLKRIGACMCLMGALFACKKSDFLAKKPDQSLVVPQTLDELQAVLDHDKVMNGQGSLGNGGPVSALIEVGSGDFYVTDTRYNTILASDPIHRNAYTWEKDIYKGNISLDYPAAYKAIFYANVALDGISKLNSAQENQAKYNNVKGSGLFFRSFLFYELMQLYAPQYDSVTANSDLGIVMRLKSDINEPIYRATVQQTYNQIINDLNEAKSLLPITALYLTRPNKPAAYALLAKVYLSMRNYEKAFLYSDSCLRLYSALVDYNDLVASSTYPLSSKKGEVLFNCIMQLPFTINGAVLKVDSNLYRSYDQNDLRKSIFFKSASDGGYRFNGSYDGTGFYFAGLATDEVYFIRAECYARKGNIVDAMADLNTLMKKRWTNTVTFPAFVASDASDALNKILLERRKELVFRGIRWSDLRRLNKENGNITLNRVVNGQTYSLQPNSLRYVYPFPDDEIALTGITQNPR